MSSDERFMEVALLQAAKSLKENTLPVGCVVVQDDEVIGTGRKLSSDFHLGHAEVYALRAALGGKKFSPADRISLYSTLEPCIMCFGAILHCPIRRVIFALHDPYGGATDLPISVLPVRQRQRTVEVQGGLLRSRSKALFQEFFLSTTDSVWTDSSNPLVRYVMDEPNAETQLPQPLVC